MTECIDRAFEILQISPASLGSDGLAERCCYTAADEMGLSLRNMWMCITIHRTDASRARGERPDGSWQICTRALLGEWTDPNVSTGYAHMSRIQQGASARPRAKRIPEGMTS